jgi:hypothetical protein
VFTYQRKRPKWKGPQSAAWHVGSQQDFVRRCQRELRSAGSGGPAAVKAVAPMLLGWIADTRNLRQAFDFLAKEGGRAPGPNGLRYDDLNGKEVWSLLRALRRQILEGNYEHGPVRQIDIPKSSGQGKRTLTLADIEDRVVARAASQLLDPLLSPRFDRHSFCRSGHSHAEALAVADCFFAEGRSLWIADDLRGAFDHVPLKRLHDIIRRRIPADGVNNLICRLTARHGDKGLYQGSSLSPLLMNLYLDHFLDRPWRRAHPNTPLLRYMDDLLVLGTPNDDAGSLYDDLARWVGNAGLKLKGSAERSILDLEHGAEVSWLGCRLSGDSGKLQIRLAIDGDPGSLESTLHQRLPLLHHEPDAAQLAWQTIRGLLDQAGPCYGDTDRRAAYQAVTRIGREYAFEEMPTQREFMRWWNASYARWRRLHHATAVEYGFSAGEAG